MKATQVGINLNEFDAFGNRRHVEPNRFRKPKRARLRRVAHTFDPYRAARQLERMFPRLMNPGTRGPC